MSEAVRAGSRTWSDGQDHGPPQRGTADRRTVGSAGRRIAPAYRDIRRRFDTTEQRSHPAGLDGGTRLYLTVDTTRAAEPARSWLETGRSAKTSRSAETPGSLRTAGPRRRPVR
ncbi:hypothetical protein [Streptomyces sp. NBC_00481]|uniref:hypothetical protein n=1 Tax=Streptomyces sp. NBC_00481 TaxID=2975755 RepID=UPI003FA3D67C